MIPLSWYLILSFILIALGAYGMMVKRNLIRILIGAEIMGNGVNIALVTFSLYSPVFNLTGQGIIILVIAVAAAHTALALVLMLVYNRRYDTVDLGKPITFNRTKIDEEYDRVQEFELQCRDGNRWKTFAQGTKLGHDYSKQFEPVTGRYIRLNILKATDGPTICEFQLFAPKN